MRQIAILGIGQTKVDEQWDKSLREIGGEAAFAAMQDARMEKVDSLYIGNMLSSMVNGQNHLGVFFSDWIGLLCRDLILTKALSLMMFGSQSSLSTHLMARQNVS